MKQKQIADYRHVNPAGADGQAPDPRPGNYYVSVFDRNANDGRGRLGLLLGPFPAHAAALAAVEHGKALANRVNDRAVWYAYGTVRMADDYNKPGVLNDLAPELFNERKAA